LFFQPLPDAIPSDFLQVGNYIRVIADSIDNWTTAELLQAWTRELRAIATSLDMMRLCAFSESMFAFTADITHKV